MHSSVRLLYALFLLLGLASTGWGQSTAPHAITFSAGYSIPIGKFASKQFNDPNAGLAGSGYFGQLSYEQRFNSWLGARLSGSLNINETNPDPIIEQYSILLPNRDTYTWQKDVTQWKFGSVLAGPAVFLRMGPIILEGHVQVGVAFARSPSLSVIGTSSTGNFPVEARVAQANSKALGLGAGGSIRVPITERLHFQITGSWIGSNMYFKDVPTYAFVGDVGPIESLQSRRRYIGVLNAGAGLAFNF
ncbi:hypothetical protein [Telluribacter sp. SYSU D00476]|uniref:hypothetical protein n=1 Tax=Telluribacter sp. SYSU D00476 TaxID=2811430 RepID=UPI001FF1E64D|nr:hypothetical protein [Telluribacter sp. SYSU D00476]